MTTPQERLAHEYGWAAQLISETPELLAIFTEAVESGEYDEATGGWLVEPTTPAEFVERVRQTEWYKSVGHLLDRGKPS